MTDIDKINKPFKDTLWTDCLFECIMKAREEGLEQVEFDDVDKLVIVKSHKIIDYKLEEERK